MVCWIREWRWDVENRSYHQWRVEWYRNPLAGRSDNLTFAISCVDLCTLRTSPYWTRFLIVQIRLVRSLKVRYRSRCIWKFWIFCILKNEFKLNYLNFRTFFLKKKSKFQNRTSLPSTFRITSMDRIGHFFFKFRCITETRLSNSLFIYNFNKEDYVLKN